MSNVKITLKPGTYIVAVSGGVDSVVLLDVLARSLGLGTSRLVVAHFDHGIRKDSAKDRIFVEKLSQKHKLNFEGEQGKLGEGASENQAREARYAFLRKIREKYNATSIITAHHQDDMVETAVINLLRGTGRKGLSSLGSTQAIERPLLGYTKTEILKYASMHKLEWHEDPSNYDLKYLRNYIRHKILPRFSEKQKQAFVQLILKGKTLNYEIDEVVRQIVPKGSGSLDRQILIGLPHAVAKEVMVSLLTEAAVKDIDSKLIERVTVAAKTYASGKQVSLDETHMLKIDKISVSVIEHISV